MKIKDKEKIIKHKKKIKSIEAKSIKKAKGFASDFKAFATKGNVIDMAVGVIIATAFTKIVNSLVSEVITPLLSIFTGKIDFSNLFIALDKNKYGSLKEAVDAGTPVINYGVFISNVIDFLMVALILFITLRYIFRKNKKAEVVQKVTTKACPYCLNNVPIEATRCGYCTSVLNKEK